MEPAFLGTEEGWKRKEMREQGENETLSRYMRMGDEDAEQRAETREEARRTLGEDAAVRTQ